MVKYYNKKVKAFSFSVGDEVLLVMRNIRCTRPSKKLDFIKEGPFRILEKINPVAYRLQLPPSWRIHNVFHISLLEKFRPSRPDTLSVTTAPSSTTFQVSAILDSRLRQGKVQYLFDWLNYGPQDRTWQCVESPESIISLFKDFHSSFPDKPMCPSIRALLSL